MHMLSSVPSSPDDELWPIVHLHLPTLPEGLPPFEYKELLNIHHTDSRLQGYRVKIVTSEHSPTDPADGAILTDDATGRQWRLWRLWVRYEPLPLVGELQYMEGQGWLETIYHPTWWAGEATPEDYQKLARGLFYVRHLIRKRGKPVGHVGEGVGKFDDLSTFLQHVEQALTDFRGHDVEPTAPVMAELLNIGVRTMHRGFTRAGLRWAQIKRSGIPESVKIFYGIL
jgi:hypothetical protein